MLAIRSTTRTKAPISFGAFSALAQKTLGDRYDLSLVVCGNALTRSFNKKFRGKDKPANILTFPLDKHTGEIFINSQSLAREAREWNTTEKKYALFLFYHGLLHLKGLSHKTMESREDAFKKKLGIPTH